MLSERRPDHETDHAAIEHVAGRLWVNPETLWLWKKRVAVGKGREPGTSHEASVTAGRSRTELADHETVPKSTDLDLHLSNPRSPWQRGTKNTIRQLRQSFPKGISMKDLTQEGPDTVAARLNSRIRKTLDYDTPASRLEALLHRLIEFALVALSMSFASRNSAFSFCSSLIYAAASVVTSDGAPTSTS